MHHLVRLHRQGDQTTLRGAHRAQAEETETHNKGKCCIDPLKEKLDLKTTFIPFWCSICFLFSSKVPEKATVGQSFRVEVSFENPLPVNLTKCELRVEGPGLQKPVVYKQKYTTRLIFIILDKRIYYYIISILVIHSIHNIL